MPKLKKTETKKQPELEVVHPVIQVLMFHSSPKVMAEWERVDKAESNPLTADVAKELLGWVTEAEMKEKAFETLTKEEQKKLKESKNVVLGDNIEPMMELAGQKMYALRNLDNRPFQEQLAEAYSLEILRKKWKFNGETYIIDKYGRVHDGQHRFAGLLMAIEEWKKDAKLPKDEQVWQKLWPEEPYMEGMVVLGIDGDDETVNTIGTGKKRSLEDVIFRSEYFDGKTNSEKKALAKITSWAIRIVWDRSSQGDNSFAPKRPHSESMDFLHRHEKLLKCVRFIYDEGADNDKFKHIVPLGYAAGLMYLMATAASDNEKYWKTSKESSLDFSLWEKAEEFWIDVANNGEATEALRDCLLSVPVEAGGSYERDLRCGLCIKAWNLYSDGKELIHEVDEHTRDVTYSNVAMETSRNEEGQAILAEHPRIGGIDVEYSPPEKKEKPKKEEKSSKETPKEVVKVEGKCPAGGEHDFQTDEEGTICVKCFEPAVKPKKGKKVQP